MKKKKTYQDGINDALQIIKQRAGEHWSFLLTHEGHGKEANIVRYLKQARHEEDSILIEEIQKLSCDGKD
ncbi:MAG: hypothetical protein Q7K54_05820 [Candidatus Parcubacteria bacterium]|nr:hypothetical protein [Candidatus Parcubacteria bacterium]